MTSSSARKTPYAKSTIKKYANKAKVSSNNICCMCLKVIEVMAFKQTGVCCEDHRKDRDKDHEPFAAVERKRSR